MANTLEGYVEQLRGLWAKHRPAGASNEVRYPIGLRTIPGHVTHWARERPETLAVVFEGETYTYAELDDAHRRVAAWLRRQGVRAGDRVAIHLSNSPEFILIFLAVLRLGAVHVPVNPMFASAELTHELSDCEPKVVITTEKHAKRITDVKPHLRHPVTVRTVEQNWQEAQLCEPYCQDDGELHTIAALNYTGGTTGLPKGCQHTQFEMLYTVASAASAMGVSCEEPHVSLCFMPIFWIAGEDVGILFPLVMGGTVVLLERWNAERVTEAIERYRVQTMLGTVENYLELTELSDIRSRDLSSFSDPTAVSFMRKLTPEIRSVWADKTNAGVLRESSFGMTETHALDATPLGFQENDVDLNAEPVFCGLPVPGTDIAVVEFGTLNPLPIGEVGELVLRSPAVTKGYWRDPEATAKQIVDGWLRTGDNARIDARGMLHYLGRRKEMIKVKGMSVFPAEVETLLAQNDEVDMVAVVPREDAERGQRPVAFVVLAEGVVASPESLEEWCRENMAGYKVPQIVLIDSMPLTTTGKVKKTVLQDRVPDEAR